MPKINVAEMPLVELRNLCRTFSAAIERSTEDPVFLAAYNRHRVGKEVETFTRENSDMRDSDSDSGNVGNCHDFDTRTDELSHRQGA